MPVTHGAASRRESPASRRQVHIREHVRPRHKCRVLKHETDLRPRAIAPENFALVRRGEAGNEAQDRRLAATGRPQQRQKLTASNLKIDASEGLYSARKGLGDSVEAQQAFI
jgi:hypothetical protein